ncbi:interleukin-15-like [Sphaeramia orbicularis]|uniref:interleukin-15-like n=1 Tax=Sphaeramia orbicularis TaxID=375764 RepID=UPI00117ECC7B|nr:interleukin-15-like [Sphaeramia orbicularis]
MKHFIRTAFWIFTLFGCLLAIPTRLMEAGSTDLDFDIDNLMANFKCEPDSTFYTQKNLRPECITTALNCFHQEFDGTVREECEGPHGEIEDVLCLLKTKINARESAGHVLNNSTACACEQGSEVPFHDFLMGLQTLLWNNKELAKQP